MRTFDLVSAAVLALAATVVAAPAQAGKSFEKEVPADPKGTVEISNTSGRVDVSGWDRPAVSVRGDLGEGVDRVEVTTESGRTIVKVIVQGHSYSRDSEAHLKVQIPKDSELHVSTVSSDATISGVNGVQRLTDVSGDVSTEIAGSDLELKTVSGDIHVKGHGQSARLRITTVSGDVHLEHGAGDLETTTVSGTLSILLDTAHSVHARTTSGDLRFEGKLTRGASFEAVSVSGDLNVRAPADGGFAYEVSSFSGDISNCFGAKREKDGVVGHSLSGSVGEGAGHMSLKTMSGDIELCDRS